MYIYVYVICVCRKTYIDTKIETIGKMLEVPVWLSEWGSGITIK